MDYRQLLKQFDLAEPKIKSYFNHFPLLCSSNLPIEESVTYLFRRTEYLLRRTLHGGLIKRHGCERTTVDRIVYSEPLFRKEFYTLYFEVFGSEVSPMFRTKLEDIAEVRNQIMHGKTYNYMDMKLTISSLLEAVGKFAAEIDSQYGFDPLVTFKYLRAQQPITSKHTIELMARMGFKEAS